jgi:hypothetical protein
MAAITTSATTPSRTLRLAGRAVPVDLPRLSDPRLHVAAVIVTIHMLGQVAFGFHVSVAQILIAIGTCAAIEVIVTLRREGRLRWPASAMLTGSGVALIFRVLGTEHGDYWSLRGWYLFALVAGLSLATKYVVRYRDTHLFNPSNVGLVAAFVMLGSSRVEPLDFWWGPFDVWMALAYAVIVVGGLLVTIRLRLLGMGLAFWIALAAGNGILALSGHCITARWSFEPVCGMHYWWVVVTSPETLVFLFFMITDPRTVPGGRVARVAFGASVGAVSTLLMAPQTTEFGAKVALLAGLVFMCLARPLFDRFLPAAGSPQDRVGAFATRLMAGEDRSDALRRLPVRAGLTVMAIALACLGLVAAGSPARQAEAVVAGGDPGDGAAAAAAVDPDELPTVTVDPMVTSLDPRLIGPGAQDLAVALARNLEVEAAAVAGRDRELLEVVDHGERLDEMRRRVDDAGPTGEAVVPHYTFDSLHLTVAFPGGAQGGPRPGFEARGTVEELTYDAAGRVVDRDEAPAEVLFAMRQASDGRWLIVDTLPLKS